MSSQPRREQANDDTENRSLESAELQQEQEQQPEILPKGAAQQSATGTGSIKVSG